MAIIWGFLPLLACYLVHSAIGCARELPRLQVCWRNRVARGLIVLMLGVGLSAMVVVFGVAQHDVARARRELIETAWFVRRGTDHATARMAAACPSDYRILLLRGNWLLDHGRTNAAAVVYRQVRADANIVQAGRVCRVRLACTCTDKCARGHADRDTCTHAYTFSYTATRTPPAYTRVLVANSSSGHAATAGPAAPPSRPSQ